MSWFGIVNEHPNPNLISFSNGIKLSHQVISNAARLECRLLSYHAKNDENFVTDCVGLSCEHLSLREEITWCQKDNQKIVVLRALNYINYFDGVFCWSLSHSGYRSESNSIDRNGKSLKILKYKTYNDQFA